MARTARFGGVPVEFRPMSPDEMQRTMQFLVEHQAQFAADFEKLSAKVDGLADSVKETKEAVNSLTTVVGHTVGLMGELTVKMGHLAEQGRRTDEHLDELAGDVRELAEQGRRTDARLDRLAELFDRHLRDDHGRKPS
jgi:archaellum component FlaC